MVNVDYIILIETEKEKPAITFYLIKSLMQIKYNFVNFHFN